jgi:hypothetical protein
MPELYKELIQSNEFFLHVVDIGNLLKKVQK